MDIVYRMQIDTAIKLAKVALDVPTHHRGKRLDDMFELRAEVARTALDAMQGVLGVLTRISEGDDSI